MSDVEGDAYRDDLAEYEGIGDVDILGFIS
jgi:hypothetical protein